MATVLVVDDDRSLQALISEALRAEGFDVAVERDGAQAVARFEHAPADAILLDVLLPGLNGFQVAERIRALPSGRAVPIVMMSGTYRGQKTSDAARAKLGLAGYIEKPFQLSVLIASLRDALTPKPIAFAQTASPSMARAPHGASAREARPAVVGAARLALRMKVGERALAWVFAELFRRRATGVLVLTRPGQQATLAYFREGLAVGAVCRGRAHHLGQLLVRDRVIEAGELEHVRLYAQGTGMRLAAALIATSHASAEILAAIAVRRFDRALVDAFGWGDGEARFFLRDRLPAGTPASSPQPPTALLYHLIRTGMSGVELAKELAPRLDERPVAAREQAWALFTHLPPQERDLLLSLDGRTSLREVIAAQSVEDAPALLLTAMCLGLILPSNAASLQAAQRAASPAPSATETPPHKADYPPADPTRSTRPSQRIQLPPDMPAPPPPPRRPTAPIVEVVRPRAPASPPPSAPAGRPVVLASRPTGPVAVAHAGAPPPKPARSAPTPESAESAAAKADDLRQRAAAADSQDHWGVLGIVRGATGAEVRAAYHTLAKFCHPDRHTQSAQDLRDTADKLFGRVSEAYRVLGDPALMAKYEEHLKRKPGDVDAAEQLARVVGAEKAFRQGEFEMKRRGYAAAVGHFEEAIRLYKEEGEYHAWLGYALALALPNDFSSQRRSASEFAVAKELNKFCSKAYLFQGYIYKSQDRTKEAEREFRAAVDIDPKEIDAERELRLINMRRPPTKKR